MRDPTDIRLRMTANPGNVIKGGENAVQHCFWCDEKTRHNQTQIGPTEWRMTCLKCGHHVDYEVKQPGEMPIDWKEREG